MPTETENVQYLYLILTHGGAPTIDWNAVGAAMDLKKGAVTKRWSRLKTSMDANQTPNGSVYKFLWLCVKHSARDKVPDWTVIAEQCGTTSCAASKRYFRMKQAFEANAAPPDSNPSSPAPKTPSKKTRTTTDGEATPTPKRKRATPKKQVVNEEYDDDDEIIKPKQDTDDDDAMTTPKKIRTTKPKVTPKPESFGMSLSKKDVATVKNEVEDDAEEPFVDAVEWVNELVDGEITSNDERTSYVEEC